MNTSSPLAAMQSSPGMAFGHHRNMLRAGPLKLVGTQIQASRPNYFSAALRGSSPSASLAIDMSQNMRIDSEKSPPFPTPRRALFSRENLDDRDRFVTTPSLPASSSPLRGDEMDIDTSPLPHKVKVAGSSFVEIHPATPDAPEEDEDTQMIIDSPVAMSRQLSLEPAKPVAECRRRMALIRPGMSRTKGYSTGAVVTRQENHVSTLKCGSETNLVPAALSSMTLGECFQDSPPRGEKKAQTAESPSRSRAGGFFGRPRAHFASLPGMRDGRGARSPTAAGHSRRTSNPIQRPRRQCRRSLSMFEAPGDVVNGKAEKLAARVMPTAEMMVDSHASQTTLPSVMDVDESQEPVLPHFFPEGQDSNIPRISRHTFLDVLDGQFNERYSHRLIIDCRFEYEYDGGHIDGAINYCDKELLARHLFQVPMDGRVLLIFHCEYSAHRAPLMARHVRSEDRAVNAEHYPKLTYPEVYILEGGYKEFFNENQERCHPQSYVAMDDANHISTCEREMGKLHQKRKIFTRAQTYAFGDAKAPPTVASRPSLIQESPVGMSTGSPILGSGSSPRRMASY